MDIICLDEIKIRVHKVVMAAASSFFRVGSRIEDNGPLDCINIHFGKFVQGKVLRYQVRPPNYAN